MQLSEGDITVSRSVMFKLSGSSILLLETTRSLDLPAWMVSLLARVQSLSLHSSVLVAPINVSISGPVFETMVSSAKSWVFRVLENFGKLLT